ncbi:HpcH/HpaI aldolase/citrate lyase family protein [Sporosarcina luteola]|uniref:HpcH/HpaI aldolase/citrate lyase family protein n=1 Tax=Sporosarcina luteola TaxID=582850 RepID=UPI00203EFF4A|nr:CoA ester lyase [Sporosarcina luteola]MCM3709134.1 CoA ester lyase [Sporosarcina luteola]
MITSYLFVPGNRPDRIEKAMLAGQAHAIIIDLEDAIPFNEKVKVRELVNGFLSDIEVPSTVELYVRINDSSTSFYKEDVDMVSTFPDIGIMLPKTESPLDIRYLIEGIATDQSIIPLIETAKGVLCAYDIASCSNQISRMAFGAVDYCLDINTSISDHGQELIYPRSALVLASRAARLQAPIDTVFLDLSDEEGLIEEIHRAKNLGMYAKLCIHPKQLDHVNTLFAPSEADIAWANKVVKSFEQALSNGLSAIQLDNKMIDLPVYKQALVTLSRVGE